MNKKTLSRIGFIMELLNVSAIDLANYLNIDRTNVSKWKNGTRPFLRTSNYFENVLNYFILKDKQILGQVLYNFFTSVYEVNTNEEDYIISCLRLFLSNIDMISMKSDNVIVNDSISLYKTSYLVYRGLEGRKSSVMELLKFALNETEPLEIIICETEQFEWAVKDMLYFNELIDILQQLLIKGHKIEIFHFSFKSMNGYNSIIKKFTSLSLHKNIRQYTCTIDYSTKLFDSFYSIKGKFIILGSGDMKCSKDLYTAKYSDPFTVQQIKLLYKRYLSLAKPIHFANRPTEVNRILNLIKENTVLGEPLYFSGIMLSIITMSEKLLIEILLNNNLTRPEYDRCLNIYRMLHSNCVSFDNKYIGSFYFSLYSITEHLIHDVIIHHTLSAMTNTTVTVTKEQYLRHFDETANFIDEHPNMKYMLNHLVKINENFSCGCFKKNNWSLVVNDNLSSKDNKLLFIEDNALTNIYINSFDEIYKITPNEYKNPAHISNLFREISKGVNKF